MRSLKDKLKKLKSTFDLGSEKLVGKNLIGRMKISN